ncbi:MAG: nucleotidyl transferase AbiEii/AbiGii toxin family protein [Desulfobacterales bacterium]
MQTEVEPDGMSFDIGSIEIAEIREGQDYQGQRIRLMASLGKARVTIQIDIAFGDAITPASETL